MPYPKRMKGIILAGGEGTRLYPVTTAVNKHLLQIYDKPLIYFPLSTLIMAGINEVIIVSGSKSIDQFEHSLGDGSNFGVKIRYCTQEKSNGIVGALDSAASLVGVESALVILGDNIFFGGGFGQTIQNLESAETARIWTKRVSNPTDYGVLEVGENGVPVGITEKPSKPKSKLAVTGLYYLPANFTSLLSRVMASHRNELEVTDLLEIYLSQGLLSWSNLSRGTAWFDAGTAERMFMASDYVRIIQERTGEIVGSPEETAFRSKLISEAVFREILLKMPSSTYKETLLNYVYTDEFRLG
jgi:glucose-1-phosphate thymidylyltransferase